MRTVETTGRTDYATLQRLAKSDLALAIELGAAEAHRERARAFRDALRSAGLGLAQLFGLTHLPLASRHGQTRAG
jgi:hypothetical protein